ncbi:MAG: hypothetical protein EOP34_08670 [Rickettsiales bacterium]|nr:MAG: hypothetical protein EOP34_08670 [Rickettsiales bacterium]
MKFTFSWLKEFLDTDKDLDTIAKTLTMIGLEVEEIIDRSIDLKDFIIVKIIKIESHPDAEKLIWGNENKIFEDPRYQK